MKIDNIQNTNLDRLYYSTDVEKYNKNIENEPDKLKNIILKDQKDPKEFKIDNKECETCKNRKYQDGSDENVSFKAAAHISPGAAGAVVRAHEQEHVSNAYSKASKNNGKVINASVTIKTATCPECGRLYVSGGVTNTQIKYTNEDNKYQKERKQQDYLNFVGNNINQNV